MKKWDLKNNKLGGLNDLEPFKGTPEELLKEAKHFEEDFRPENIINNPIIQKTTYEVNGSELQYCCPKCHHTQNEWGKCEKCKREHGVKYKNK